MDKGEKKRKFLIATHGTFSAGIKSSLDIILGSVGDVFLIQAYIDDTTSVETEIKKILEQIIDEDELIIFSDILGGSITNKIIEQAAHKPNIHIVTGFNLPLLIDIILADKSIPAEEAINTALDNAREQMVYVSKLLTL
jgi:fructoselysine/glucoselysine PTS system EIIA component